MCKFRLDSNTYTGYGCGFLVIGFGITNIIGNTWE
jgi:hypothetical protein